MKQQFTGSLSRKCLAELAGTFVLVFAGTGAIVIDELTHGAISHLGVGLVFGLVVMAMIYALGESSGAHLNPAVTMGFWTAGRISARVALSYVFAQVIGALLASLVVRILFPAHATLGATIPTGGYGQSFLLEFILTAILMMVILCVSTGSKEAGIMAGIAIGGTVGLEAIFAGPICGASMNPARSIGPAIVSGHMTALWIYLAAPVAGALFGVAVWLGVRPAASRSCRPDTGNG